MNLTLQEKWQRLTSSERFDVELATGIQNHAEHFRFLSEMVTHKIDGQMLNARDGLAAKTLRVFNAQEVLELLDGISYPRAKQMINALDIGGKGSNGHFQLALPEINLLRQELGKQDPLRFLKGKALDPHRETFLLSVLNYKGGVGKTTTVINLAHYLALQGYKVLFVDMDPQASSTFYFGILPTYDIQNPDTQTMRHILGSPMSQETLATLEVRPTHWENIDLIPGHAGLYGIESKLEKGDEWWKKIEFARKEGAFDAYDIVLFDTSPAFSSASLNALWASHGIIIPVYPSPLTLWSLSELYGLLDESFAKTTSISGEQPNLKFVKLLPTLFTRSLSESNQEDLNDLRRFHGSMVYDIEMYRKPGIAEANAHFSTAYEMANKDISGISEAKKMLNKVNRCIEKDIIRGWQLLNPEASNAHLHEKIDQILRISEPA